MTHSQMPNESHDDINAQDVIIKYIMYQAEQHLELDTRYLLASL